MDDDRPIKPNPQTSASLAAIRQLGANAPSFHKIVSGANSIGATALLTFAGYTYTAIHSEWEEMRDSVESVRRDLDKMPTPEEIDDIKRSLDSLEAQALAGDPNVTSKIEDLRSRIIVIEGLCCGGPDELPALRGRTRHTRE